MKLLPLPAFDDNYIWMLQDGHQALVVDPGDPQPVFNALERSGLQLQAILVTHHHADHTGGIDALRNATGAVVYGPARETIPGPITLLEDGQTVSSLGLKFQVMDVPGHTSGHIAFMCAQVDGKGLLFCGDTLFSGGCGRLFEGTPAQMLDSLDRLAALPPDTVVCCTHEYTLSNLKFALEVDAGNADLQAYNLQCQTLRAQGLPTLPSSIGLERKINPFLRSREAALIASARRFDATAVEQSGAFATLRQWKNQYR
jgi:hydroxyacylglutathione hydrolase